MSLTSHLLIRYSVNLVKNISNMEDLKAVFPHMSMCFPVHAMLMYLMLLINKMEYNLFSFVFFYQNGIVFSTKIFEYETAK